MGRQTEVSLVGDVGGWDATAKLDYRFAAILATSSDRNGRWKLDIVTSSSITVETILR
jgi:hypothetical protein